MATIDKVEAGPDAGIEDGRPPLPAVVFQAGAVCAIVGSVLSVIAGARFDNLTVDASAGAVLDELATRPDWSWPSVGLTFIAGSLLWLAAFTVLAASLRRPGPRLLGRVAVAAIILGTAIHVIDAGVNAGLADVARGWPGPDDQARQESLVSARTLLHVLAGTWQAVVMLFHGVPFLVMGVAVSLDTRYPGWSGWLGIVGGIGSIVLGGAMFLGSTTFLYIVFAVGVSVWMMLMGVLLWLGASRLRGDGDAGGADVR